MSLSPLKRAGLYRQVRSDRGPHILNRDRIAYMQVSECECLAQPVPRVLLSPIVDSSHLISRPNLYRRQLHILNLARNTTHRHLFCPLAVASVAPPYLSASLVAIIHCNQHRAPSRSLSTGHSELRSKQHRVHLLGCTLTSQVRRSPSTSLRAKLAKHIKRLATAECAVYCLLFVGVPACNRLPRMGTAQHKQVVT